jgi:uncharacterized OsmC-like protein
VSDQIKTAVQQLQQAIAGNPAAAKAVFRASTGSTEDSFATDSSVRSFAIRLDEPAALGGADTGANPVEAVLAALGSCQAIVYRAYANVLGLRLDRVDVEARGYLDLRGFLGDPAVAPGFERVAFSTRITSPEPAEKILELAALVDKHCPVLDILRRPLEVAGTFEHVTPGSARDAA